MAPSTKGLAEVKRPEVKIEDWKTGEGTGTPDVKGLTAPVEGPRLADAVRPSEDDSSLDTAGDAFIEGSKGLGNGSNVKPIFSSGYPKVPKNLGMLSSDGEASPFARVVSAATAAVRAMTGGALLVTLPEQDVLNGFLNLDTLSRVFFISAASVLGSLYLLKRAGLIQSTWRDLLWGERTKEDPLNKAMDEAARKLQKGGFDGLHLANAMEYYYDAKDFVEGKISELEERQKVTFSAEKRRDLASEYIRFVVKTGTVGPHEGFFKKYQASRRSGHPFAVSAEEE